MDELDELQAFFAAQLTSRRALPRDPAISEQAGRLIEARGGLSGVERLEIYREQFWLRHTSSLVEDFPGVSGILGQEAWQPLVEGYFAEYPPHSFTLRDLGLDFPSYVAARSSLPQHALCSDMARLELAYLELFDAADAAPISPEALAAISESDWERACLLFQPALRLLEVAYPVAALRRSLIEAPGHAELPAAERQYLLLYRRELHLHHEQLSAPAYHLLSALLQGEPLVFACARVQAGLPDAPEFVSEHLAGWFQSWSSLGLVTGVEVLEAEALTASNIANQRT